MLPRGWGLRPSQNQRLCPRPERVRAGTQVRPVLTGTRGWDSEMPVLGREGSQPWPRCCRGHEIELKRCAPASTGHFLPALHRASFSLVGREAGTVTGSERVGSGVLEAPGAEARRRFMKARDAPTSALGPRRGAHLCGEAGTASGVVLAPWRLSASRGPRAAGSAGCGHLGRTLPGGSVRP